MQGERSDLDRGHLGLLASFCSLRLLGHGGKHLDQIDPAILRNHYLDAGAEDVDGVDFQGDRLVGSINSLDLHPAPFEHFGSDQGLHEVDLLNRQVTSETRQRSIAFGIQPSRAGGPQHTRKQLDGGSLADVGLEIGEVEIGNAHIGLDVKRPDADVSIDAGLRLTKEQGRGLQPPLGARFGDDVSEHETGILQAKLHRFVEGSVLEARARRLDLETADLDLPRKGLLNLVIGFHRLLAGLLGNQGLPAECAVGLDPHKGIGAFHNHRTRTERSFRPDETSVGDGDRRHLQDSGV